MLYDISMVLLITPFLSLVMDQERFEEFDEKTFYTPSDMNLNIWRYMDFTKFVSLLNSGSLHLTRYDQFDEHLGEVFQQELNACQEKDKNEFRDKAILTPEQLPAIRTKLWKKHQHQYIFINCWHIIECEPTAMWKLYAKSNGAIAIQTTYTKLKEALPAGCHIGEVKYTDYQNYISDKIEFSPVMHKRKSFEHEREIRVCYVDFYEFQQDIQGAKALSLSNNTPVFETIPIDLQTVIESVQIAPEAPEWLVRLVKDSLIRFGYDLPVCQSN